MVSFHSPACTQCDERRRGRCEHRYSLGRGREVAGNGPNEKVYVGASAAVM